MGEKVVTFFHVGEIKPYIHLMVRSIRTHIPAPLIQMTDMETPEIDGVDSCIRIESSGVAKARIDHLSLFEHEEMLHLDTDVIVKRNVLDVFDNVFDVALTIREHERSPYNSGVMFSRSREFWEDCSKWFADQGPKTANWGGDQRSVNAVAQFSEFHVLDLPCEVYNWSPSVERRTNDDAAIVHYKGDRKKWMR